jgi:glycosyltransferase involved in cell wall biosynthesis
MPNVSNTAETKRQPDLAPPEMSVVIPVFNEERIVEGSLRELYARLGKLGRSFEIIVVENGSTDKTPEILREISAEWPELRVLHHGAPNYGAALKAGLYASRGRYIHTDEIDMCDVDFHRRALELFVGEDGGFEMVVGSKTMKGARDDRPMGRRLATRVINTLLRITTGFRGTDTHGLKAFRREALLSVLDACVVSHDMFASELVIRAERSSLRIVEIPLNLKEKREPSIRLRSRVPGVLRDLAKLSHAVRQKPPR